MLEELRISQLGVIDSSTLELGPGLTVITGETGAGKTMVVTALGLLLGGRADPGAVRTGARQARVEGVVSTRDLAGFREAVEDAGGIVEDGGHREAVALARLVVVVVVRRRDLDRARPERRIDHRVRDDRDVAVHERDPHEPPDEHFPLQLITGRTIYHFHTRTKTGRAPELQAAAPQVWVEICAADAAATLLRPASGCATMPSPPPNVGSNSPAAKSTRRSRRSTGNRRGNPPL